MGAGTAPPTTTTPPPGLPSEVASAQPVGWWRFNDDLSYGIAAEANGGPVGTYTGTRELVEGVLGDAAGAIRLDAPADAVVLPGDLIAPTSIAVEVWAKPEPGGGATQRIIRHREHGYHLDWLRDVGTFAAGLNLADAQGNDWGSASLIPSVTFATGEWHHLVLTVEPGEAVLYINGVVHDRFIAPATHGVYYSGTGLTAGNDTPGSTSRTFTGSIDELAIYNRPLTASEVESHYTSTGRTVVPAPPPATSGDYGAAVLGSWPVAYWPLDEMTNNLVADDAIAGFDGDYSSYNLDWEVPGAYEGSNAVGFDHPEEIVTLPGSSLQPSELTLEAWVRPESGTSHVQRIIRHRAHGFAIDWDPTAQQFNGWAFVGDGSQSVSLTSDPVSADEWHHVAFIVDEDNAYLVINGELQAQQANPAGADIYYAGTSLVLGNDTFMDANRYFVGEIDDLAIYDRALPVGEIAAHVEAAGELIGISPDIESVVTCASNGGNIFFEVSTYVSTEDEFLEGCYYVESCISDMVSVVGAIAEWSCTNQDRLLSILDAVAVPAEILHNVTDEVVSGAPSVGAALAYVGTAGSSPVLVPPAEITIPLPGGTPPPAPTNATGSLLQQQGPGSTGGTSWTLRAGGLLLLTSEIAYQTTEFVDTPDRVETALLRDIGLIERIGDTIRVTPDLAPVDADRQRRIAAMTCVQTIAVDQVAAATGQVLDADGFNSSGEHACELIDVFLPGSSWTTAGGVVRNTVEATTVDANAITSGTAPAVLTRRQPSWPIFHTQTVNGAAICSAPTGQECQDYPFRSTYEGGRANWDLGKVVVLPIDFDANQGEGNALNAFYGAAQGCDVKDGTPPDTFVVVPMPGQFAPGTTWRCA
ncbi:MAG: LamG domain-containing protein [Actinomycetota bacterium]